MKQEITIKIDTDRLPTYADEHLATLWHVAQGNPVPYDDHDAGQLAEHIAMEIVRRWVAKVPAPVWNHQGRSHYKSLLCEHGKWLPVDGDKHSRRYTPNSLEALAAAEQFVRGFEGDEAQEGVGKLLALLRGSITEAQSSPVGPL